MAKTKAKIRETFRPDTKHGNYRRIWIVSYNGQSQEYYEREAARQAKAKLDKA